MAKETIKNIYFVDDEPRIREVISDTLQQLNVNVTCFAGGHECLKQIESQGCDLLITDLKMPGMDGLELMEKVKGLIPWMPVLVITAFGDIPLAIKTVKSGAVDFIEKPLEKETFLRKVKSILQDSSSHEKCPDKPLTKSESQILKYLVEGKNNREIAESLHRSIRTIEVHRSHIMQKFKVNNMVDLIKSAAMFGLIEMSNKEKKQAYKRRKKNNN